jgi:hypothetical protein
MCLGGAWGMGGRRCGGRLGFNVGVRGGSLGFRGVGFILRQVVSLRWESNRCVSVLIIMLWPNISS